jgi:hypothetical protein
MNCDYKKLDAETVCIDGDDIYLFAQTMNLLYRYNLKAKKTKLLGTVPGRKIQEQKLFGKILKYEEKVILIPFQEEDVWIFDLLHEDWKRIELEKTENKNKQYFYQAFLHNGVVHMIGCYYPAIVRLDLTTMDVSYDRRVFDEIKKIPSKHDEIYFRTEYIRKNNEILMGCCNVNRILKYNLDSHEYQLIEIGKNDDDFEGISSYENQIILFARHEQNMYLWKDDVVKVKLPEMIQCHYMATVKKDGKYILLGNSSGNSCFYCNGKFVKVEETCLFCEKQDENNYIYMSNDKVLVVVQDGAVTEHECIVDTGSFNEFFKDKFIGDTVQESVLFDTDFFIAALK